MEIAEFAVESLDQPLSFCRMMPLEEEITAFAASQDCETFASECE